MSLFSGLMFHYPDVSADYTDIRELIELNGGCMTIEELAEFHLLPVGAKPWCDEDDFMIFGLSITQSSLGASSRNTHLHTPYVKSCDI
jgi:hypothetical protein